MATGACKCHVGINTKHNYFAWYLSFLYFPFKFFSLSKHDTYPVLAFSDAALFERWLARNHTKQEGIWIKIAKLKSGIPSVTYSEALDIALCYGWIDGLKRGFDEQYFIQKFTPRTSKSIWSVINKKKVAALIKEGKMKDAGLAAIAVAKKNGRWKAAYASQNTITVPGDLETAINKNENAKSFFPKLSSQNRYAILFRLSQIITPEKRTIKIAQFVRMLDLHETIYPQKDK